MTKLERFQEAWAKNYPLTALYVAVLVTLIFGFQMYRYFVSVPADEVTQCPTSASSRSLVPVIGVFLDG